MFPFFSPYLPQCAAAMSCIGKAMSALAPALANRRCTRQAASAAILAAILASFATVASHADSVGKTNGATTPLLSDFSSTYASKANQIGYQNHHLHHTFLETFAARCGAPHMRVNAATFTITLRKLGITPRDAEWTRLIFWDRGAEHFNTRIWSPHEPAGSVKTLRFNIAALPRAGGQVKMNDGWGLALLADRDFSFSVNDDASVLSARLDYQCVGAQGNTSAGGYTPTASGGISFRTAIPVGYQGPNDAPCSQPGIAFARADAYRSTYLTRITPGTDSNCRSHGSRQGIYTRVVFLSCTAGAAHGQIRHLVNVEIFCAP